MTRTTAHRLTDTDAAADLQRVVDVVGVALAVDGVGAASAVLELTVAYATEREQFGVPIGSFQAVQHLCADMLRDLEIAAGRGLLRLVGVPVGRPRGAAPGGGHGQGLRE